MTEIICEFSHGKISAISVSGHTGYGTSGNDVVCAGVSALIQALSIGLEDVLELEGLQKEFYIDDEPYIKLVLPMTDDRVEILARTIYLSFKEMEKGYPGHVRLTEVQR